MKNGTSSSGATKKSARFTRLAWVFLAAVILSPALEAQQAGPAQAIQPAQIRSAPVIIDGKQLFVLRGVSAYPAEQRAADVRDKIIELAQDESFDPNDLSLVQKEEQIDIMAGEYRVFGIFDGDADLELGDLRVKVPRHEPLAQ